MSQHSSIVGGSTAARVLACPGSVVANLNLPPAIAVVSEYAEEGSFYHAVMAALLEARQENNDEDLELLAGKWIGQTFHDRKLTQAHIDEGITPALACLAELEAEYGGGFHVFAVERRVKFPALDAFGTLDLILRNIDNDILLHVDFKFGQGVPVAASYPDGTNKQLLFYIAASRQTFSAAYRLAGMVAAIIQPRVEGNRLTHCMVSRAEVNLFRRQLHQAVATALSPGAPRAKGEHCRWAPCKLTCPLWAGPLLDAAAFKLPTVIASEQPDAYAKHLALAKQLVDVVAVLKTEVDLQLHTYLANGGKVPGWRLKLKQKNRQWIDEKTVDKDLRKLGMKAGEIWRKKLLTFEAADAWAKRKRKKIPDHLRVAPPSNETTIAADNDPAPRVEQVTVIEQFRASLRQLVGPDKTSLAKPETGDRL